MQGHQGSFPSSCLTQHPDFPGILAPCMCNGEQVLATQESGLRLWAPSSRASSNPDPHLSESGWRKLAAWVAGRTAGLHRSQLRAITGLRVAKGRQSHSLEAQAAMGRGVVSLCSFGGARGVPTAGGPWGEEAEVLGPLGVGRARVTSSALRQRARVRLPVRVRALRGAPFLRVHDQQHVDGHGVAVLLQLHGATSLPAGAPRPLVRLPALQMAPCALLPGAGDGEGAGEGAPPPPSRCALRFADSAKHAIRPAREGAPLMSRL